MSLKNIRGIWLPDHEEHLLMFATHDGWSYQKHKLDAAVQLCKSKGLAIDIGGHCGLWSKHLVNIFDDVVAFEPVSAHRECYVKNVKGDNYTLHPVALGKEEGSVQIHTTEGSSGDSWVKGSGDIPMKLLDSFNLTPDFIKIDTEGFEYNILLGGEQTVRAHKPVIIVEQKPDKGSNFGLKDTAAVELLKSWGYEVKSSISGDYIMVPCDSGNSH
jgi:FkbM family methyltransferase